MLAETWFIGINLRKYPSDDDRAENHCYTHSEMKLHQFSNSLGLIFANSKISSNSENPREYSNREFN